MRTHANLCSSTGHLKRCSRSREARCWEKQLFEIYRAKDAERIDASDNEALANELGAYSPDYEIEMPHGDTRILATNRIVASDSQGVARHLIVVMDDVTEKKSPSSVSHLWPTTMF